MIYTILRGGLGNQMFQYAAGRRLALRHGTGLTLDVAWFDGPAQKADAPRFYELGCFELDPAVGSSSRPRRRAPRLLHTLTGRRASRVYGERRFAFDPAVLDLPDASVIDGYWQSEKYFADAGDVIRSDFRFRQPATGRNAATAALVSQPGSVSLHVRRADYVTSVSASAFHGLAPVDYYRAAVAAARECVPDARFFIFSDDPGWCRDHLDVAGGDATVVAHNPPTRGFEDLRLMSLCQHHIIANSTFSWWGAWLGADPAKKVFAPRRWFADTSVDTSDLPCPGWILL